MINHQLRVKICGITKLDQARAIAQLGASALGFICVNSSPRYQEPAQIKNIIQNLSQSVDLVGVFANTSIDLIADIVNYTGLTIVQLHGNETPAFCQELKANLPEKIEIIKALRIKDETDLKNTEIYYNDVDILLLDAYHPHILGGTGKTLDWRILQKFKPPLPWFLAGGLNPDNILECLEILHPDGIDLSSGVESSPGDKDLIKVKLLFDNLTSKRIGEDRYY